MKETEEPKVGDITCQFEADSLTLEAVVSRVDEEGFWCRLALSGSPESEAWVHEEATETADTYAFGCWFDGAALPVWWGDIDGDGKLELITSTPKGDLSPAVFRIFRWTGEELFFIQRRSLIGSGDGSFHWSNSPEDSDAESWIEDFIDGKAEIITLKGQQVEHRSNLAKPTATGFHCVHN